MRNDQVYSTKNVFLLVGIFVTVFWLLYSLASYWHESLRIQREVELIQETNQQKLAEIEEKKAYLEYLRTPQRIDKEAKMQMGKKQSGENVMVFIEKRLNFFPAYEGKPKRQTEVMQADIPPWDKWKWLFVSQWRKLEKW